MAGEIESGWVKLGIEAAAFLVSFGGLIGYVRSKLALVDKHEERIATLESTVAKGVRPEDIKLVRNDISELRKDLRAVLGAKE